MPEKTSKVQENRLTFCEVPDSMVLLPILKQRLPISVMLYNQVLMSKKFKDDVKFYTVGAEVNSNTWVVSNNKREDYQNSYMISAPVDVIEGHDTVLPEVKQCFANGGMVFQWDKMDNVIMFTTARPVSDLIVEVSSFMKGNITEVHPCYMYYMERDDALDLEIKHDDPNIEIRRLDPSKGDGAFIVKTWEYSIPGSDTEIAKCISRNASGGLFINGQCVCGVYIAGVGFLSALYTLKEHRKKGYAKLVEKFTFKEYAKDGHIPCLAVERRNPGSIKFHEGLGLKLAGEVNSLIIKRLNVD